MSIMHEYTLIIQWSEEDQLYLAYCPELPGCITHGRSYLEAAEMGVEVMELCLDGAREAGEPAPVPLRYQDSGETSLRRVAERLAAAPRPPDAAAPRTAEHDQTAPALAG